MRYGRVSCTASGPDSPDDDQPLLAALAAHQPLLARKIRWAKQAGLLRHHHQNEDAWQAAHLGFIEAHRRYDASRGVSIGAFARTHVMGAVREALATYVTPDATVSIDEMVDEVGEDVLRVDGDAASRDEAREIAAMINRFVVRLTPHQQYIIEQVYWRDRSQADVARELGVTRQAVAMALESVYVKGRSALAKYCAA